MTIRLGILFACAVALLLSSCRTPPPVVRHFLRMPAEYAGGLSRVDRAQWLKETKRYLKAAGRDRAAWKKDAARGYLWLCETSTRLGATMGGTEVVSAPGAGGSTAGLAVVSSQPERVRLIEFRPPDYVDVTGPAVGAGDWVWTAEMKGEGPQVLGTTATGRRVVFRWNGTAWSAQGP